MNRTNLWRALAVMLCTCCLPLLTQAQSALEEFEYDPLGRLITVSTDGQAEVGYCYDKAGNRVNVNTSGGNQDICDSLVFPSSPTNLSQGSHQGGGCYIRWQATGDIDHFDLQIKSASLVTIGGDKRYYEHNTKCFDWIRACNAGNTCSDKAYF